MSTGPKTPEGKARVVAALQEGRMRRIAELAMEGKKIRTGRGRKLSAAEACTKAWFRQIEEADKAEQEKSKLRRKLLRKADLGTLTNADARAYAGVRTNGELIEWAKAALPELRQRLLGST
jgi:hypothetical protein